MIGQTMDRKQHPVSTTWLRPENPFGTIAVRSAGAGCQLLLTLFSATTVIADAGWKVVRRVLEYRPVGADAGQHEIGAGATTG